MFQGGDVVGRNVDEAGGEGREMAVEDRLPGGGEHGQGAAVEAVFQRDDDRADAVAVSVRGVFAGNFDGAFVGFGAGVAEECALHAGAFAQQLRETGLRGGVELV